MNTTQRTTTPNGLYVKVGTVGRNFGFDATVQYRNGRVIAITDTYPTYAHALTAAQDLAAQIER